MATTCYRHTDRATGRACTRCGRPACADCLHDAPVGSHCAECVKAGRPPAAERIRRSAAAAGPIATKVIIALNVLVFAAVALEGGEFMGRAGGSRLQAELALFGPAVTNGEWYRLITAGFVHYGLLHLAFNMVILYRFGSMLEPALGRIRLVALYLAALLGGSFGAVLLDPNAFTAGASGAVFGLVAASALGLRQRGIDVWQSGVGPLLAVNLVFTFAIPGISIGGHIGGMIGGAVVGEAMLRTPPTARYIVQGVILAAAVCALEMAGSLWTAGR